MNARARIEREAHRQGWTVDAKGQVMLYLARGVERLDIEFDRADRVVAVRRCRFDILWDSLGSPDRDKCDTLLAWMRQTRVDK